MVLTDRQLQAWLKSPPNKKIYVREGQGLTVRRMPGGSVTFLHIYTHKGKRKELVLGHYPQTDLAEARKRHRKSQTDLDAGVDPQGFTPDVLTVGKLIERYINEYCQGNKKANTVKENRRALELYILPVMGHRPASEIRKADAIGLIDNLASRVPGMAQQTMKIARAMFAWAEVRELVEYNPFAGVSKSVPSVRQTHREKTLSDEEIKIVWSLLTSPSQDKKSATSRRALITILVTGQRPGEVAGMTADEVNGDWWTIPAERSKNKKATAVFLTDLAKMFISQGMPGGPVFPGSKLTTLTASSLSHYVKKSSAIQQAAPGWTPHDLRRTCATGLSKLGCSDEIIDAILNHTKKGVIKIYNRHRYDQEKKEWLQRWSDYLESIT